MLPLLLLSATAKQQPFQFAVTADKGLTISVAGVPIVQGSWVQFYSADWSTTYFSSMNGTQSVKKLENGDTELVFKSSDGKAYGTEQFTALPYGLKVSYSFGWTGDKAVSVEVTAGALWAQPLQHGTLTVNGTLARSLTPTVYNSDDISTRLYASNCKDFVFNAPAGKLTFNGSESSWTCFDARNMNKLWAKKNDLLWLGTPALQVAPNSVTTSTAEWHFQAAPSAPVHGGSVSLVPEQLPAALSPTEGDFPLLPTPKESLLKKDQPMKVGDVLDMDLPSAAPDLGDDLVAQAKLRWDVPNLKAVDSESGRFIVRVQDLNLPAESYEIHISSKLVVIEGQDVAGLRHAITTLGQLFYEKDGQLCLPGGIIRDWPSDGWRGVHLFVGPDALQFQQKLWNRVLRPLKFNHVVLECERTKWEALPNPKPEGYMSRYDLLSLFRYYRGVGVEPIPLIQSFGHMGWLFADKQTDDLALFPSPAYSIDPRLPKSKQIVADVWDEAINLLRPKAIHFGLDEVNLRWPTKDPVLTTQLWQIQLPYLANIAIQHNCQMMCWGDQCLAPGEAPDAALADDEKAAVARRAFIPKGTWVTDWHYKDDPNPQNYLGTIDLWKQDGVWPIASTWFRAENIRGFYLAAIQEGAGTLQTTWAGYNSDEPNMIREFRQFAAMIVAGDYAWSGRKDDYDKLGYDPFEVFSRMYFEPPSELTPVAGTSANLGGGVESKIGNVTFKYFEPYSLRSLLTPETSALPGDLQVQTPGLHGHELCLAVDTTTATDVNTPVADFEIEMADGTKINKTLIYGVDVRSTTDPKANVIGPRANGLSLVRLNLGDHPMDIAKLVFHSTSAYAGLRLHGVTAF
ncbi:MAG TPA: glycoside hydrolase family 20 zincin-like fold domain-containing protein [Fimbriimonadaceae bacterium]|jgi:hypothetical protein